MLQELDGTKGYKLRDTTDLKERVVSKELTFKLSEDDYADKGKLAGSLAGELRKLGMEFDSVKKEWKTKIEEKEGKLGDVLTTIRRGEEERRVLCIEQRDFAGHQVHYIFNGQILHSRELLPSERQFELVKPANLEKIEHAETPHVQ